MKYSSFCCICFSRDSKLSVIGNNELVFFNTVAEQAMQMIKYLHSQSVLKICYECRGRVHSNQKFNKKVNDSMQIVKNYWASTSSKAVLPVSFKGLSQSKILMIECPPQNEPEKEKNNYTAESYCSSESIKVEKFGSYIEVKKGGSTPDEELLTIVKEETNIEHDDYSVNATEHDVKERGSDPDKEVLNIVKEEINIESDDYSVNATEHDIEPSTSRWFKDIAAVRTNSDYDEDLEIPRDSANPVNRVIPAALATRPKPIIPTVLGIRPYPVIATVFAIRSEPVIPAVLAIQPKPDARATTVTRAVPVLQAKQSNPKKPVTYKRKHFSTAWLDIWVTEQQALSWYSTEVDRQTSTETTCVCDHCKKGFTGKDELEKHLVCCHFDGDKFECNICKYKFTSISQLHKHIKYHYLVYKCEMCDYNTRDLNLIQTHTGPDHKTVGNGSSQISIGIPLGALQFCKKCRIYFASESQFSTHSEKYGCLKILKKCGFCCEVFLEIELKTEHMQRIHNQELTNRKPEKKHILKKEESDKIAVSYCKLCDIFFKTIDSYKSHLKQNARHVKTEDKKPCPYCDKNFHSQLSLKMHIKNMHLNIRFRCTKCPKAYSNRTNLKLHIAKIHDKNFVPIKDKICDVCGAAFETIALVTSHRRRHTGERPYKCPLCPSTFSYKAALYTHNKLVHLKQKRECDLKKLKSKKKVI